MNLNTDDWNYYVQQLDDHKPLAVAADFLMGNLMRWAKDENLTVAGDDRAARLELAIYQYLLESQRD